ncbi:unnamed protein product [Fusarium graminearum]|nr:unnamed protein product [Fusarium graminearum]
MSSASKQQVPGCPPPVRQPGTNATWKRSRFPRRNRHNQSSATPKHSQFQQVSPSDETSQYWPGLNNFSTHTSSLPLTLPSVQPQQSFQLPAFQMPALGPQQFSVGSDAVPQCDPTLAESVSTSFAHYNASSAM